MLNLTFPTQQLFPTYPTRPAAEDDDALSAFMDALQEFFQQLWQQRTTTNRYFAAADFYFNDSNQDGTLHTESADVTEQAIAAVVKNIVQPLKREYVWDPAQHHWVLNLVPR
jgi:hypothetical protein